MKTHKFTWFLILVLCVFYSSVPRTVFAQGEPLAQQVFNTYRATLQRADIKALLPGALRHLRDPDIRNLLTDTNIDLVIANPNLLTTFFTFDIDESLITLLTDDADVRTMLGDQNVKNLLRDIVAIEALAGLLRVEKTIVNTGYGFSDCDS